MVLRMGFETVCNNIYAVGHVIGTAHTPVIERKGTSVNIWNSRY